MFYRSSRFLLITTSLLVVIVVTSSFQMVSYVDEDTQIKLVFSYGVGARNVLDTFSKTFTKDMIGDPPITIRMWLTEEEINRIERKLDEVGFFGNSPLTLYHIPDVGGVSTIQSHYSICYLKVQYGTHVKEWSWIDQYVSPKTEAKENLDELSDLIQSIIMAKPEYQKLPEPRGGYA